ncbi:carboxypeptidase B [Manduca sexta]|uniref:carboxypeptidase B n=1 Tax=Manduca sexta TaxID=7130 RepID=UPI0011820005|nr:carboxypeptidase B [Manduca sexta]
MSRSIILLFLGVVLAKHEIYEGHAVYEVSVKNYDQGKFLNQLQYQLEVDFWSYAVPGRPGMVLVSKDKRSELEEILKAENIEFEVKTENIKELLDLEENLLEDVSKKSYNASRSAGLPFDRIYTYKQVDEYLEMLAKQFPETVKIVNAGKSFEGRDMKYLKISTSNFEDDSKPIVFIESLLHAREWITLPATLYVIHKLVIDVTERDLLQDINWIILPIANPDGYVHSHEQARFWRKNRATGFIPANVCVGVDLNRNFDINWSTASSGNVCLDTFHGSAPFSEPETANIRDIFTEYSDRLELFLDIHSFGSMILYGWGTGVLPDNGLIFHSVAVRMANAIDTVKMPWNRNYIVGNSALVLYQASGSAMDYGIVGGADLSYTYELPGFRGGSGMMGFLVNPEFIEQAGFETWEGIKVGARHVRDKFKRKARL